VVLTVDGEDVAVADGQSGHGQRRGGSHATSVARATGGPVVRDVADPA
jgi:hypothetical protein